MSRVLIVDDEQAVCWALERALKRDGHAVAVAASAEEAFKQAERQPPDAIILDVRLPGVDGLSALGELRALANDAPVIVITAFGNLSTAVRAVEAGAFDYLTKPFDLDQALAAVDRALRQRALAEEDRSIDQPGIGPPEEMVGNSPAMQTVFKRIALVAPRESCVLITGASGTGKELVARAVHRYSNRRDLPFLPIHVAALNPGLVESELFGHLRGAFTGAAQTRPGQLVLANGGTVFFDEVADIPLPVQVKLLRVLEQQEIFPVGCNQPQALDIRILAATHQDLEQRVREGAFRQDLFYRLNVFQVHLPALRERRQDIPALAEHFLRRFDPRLLPLPPRTIEFLQAQPWLGNVRELRNAIEHAVIVARSGPLLADHFPSAMSLAGLDPRRRLAEAVVGWLTEHISTVGSPPTDLYQQLLQRVEPALLDEVLRRVRGNRWVAAQWLGLNRATVRKKLASYDLLDAHRHGEAEPAEEGE